MPPSITTEANKKRIPSLDGLRAISIFCVILAHVSAQFATPLQTHVLRSLSGMLGYFGVTVFFVISGFLITTLLLRERDYTGTLSLPKFYGRRALRILPASLAYIFVVLLLGQPTLAQSLYALSFTTTYFFDAAYPSLQHLWSLSVEEQFYLLWPFVVFVGGRRSRIACWALLVASPLVRLALKHYGYAEFDHCAPAIADSIAAGCLLAFYREEVRSITKRLCTSGVMFAVFCLTAVVGSFELYRSQMVILWGLVPVSIALIASAAIDRKDWLLNNKPIVWIGLLSYSLYLWQQPFLTLGGPLHNVPARLFLTLVCAYISYRLVEQPALRFTSFRKAAVSPSTLQPAVGEPDIVR